MLRSDEVAVPEVVSVSAVKSMVPDGVMRKPDSTALAVLTALFPAVGMPVLSMVAVPVSVCWLPAAVPLSVPVVVTSLAAAMPPVKVRPAVAAAAALAMTR